MNRYIILHILSYIYFLIFWKYESMKNKNKLSEDFYYLAKRLFIAGKATPSARPKKARIAKRLAVE